MWGVWLSHGLTKKTARLLWVNYPATAVGGAVTEAMLQKIRRLKPLSEASDNNVAANELVELISQDLHFVGTIKGVGKIYM